MSYTQQCKKLTGAFLEQIHIWLSKVNIEERNRMSVMTNDNLDWFIDVLY